MEIQVFPHQLPCFLGSVFKPVIRSSFTCFAFSFTFCPEIKLFKAVCLFSKSMLLLILADCNVSTPSQSHSIVSLKYVSVNLFCICLCFLFVLTFIFLDHSFATIHIIPSVFLAAFFSGIYAFFFGVVSRYFFKFLSWQL